MNEQTRCKPVKRDMKSGIFSFFTGSGFLDLEFEDAYVARSRWTQSSEMIGKETA